MADDIKKKRYYLLETAVRFYCALVESQMMVFPRTVFRRDDIIAALKTSPSPQYGQMLSEMSAEESGRVLNYISALPPNVPEGYVYEFGTKENAEKFIEHLREWDAFAQVEALDEKLVNVASRTGEIEARIAKALEQLGGREWANPVADDFEGLDSELPAHMLAAGTPVELVERALTNAVKRLDGQLVESVAAEGAPEEHYKVRLESFARARGERLILGVEESLVRAMHKAKVLPPAVVPIVKKALGEDDAIGSSGPGDQQVAGAPPDKGGVAKDQPDVSKGSPARSQSGSKEEPKAPTEHVPDTEQGAPMGDVTLPDGTVVPQDVLRQAFSKMLQVLATQVQQSTEGGQPKGPTQEPEKLPTEEKPPGEEKDKKDEKKPEGDKKEPPKDGENPGGEEKPAEKGAPPFAKKESVAESTDDGPEPSPELLKALESYDEKAALKDLSLAMLEGRVGSLSEVAPPGMEKLVRKLKKHREISNPFALAWWMKNKGYKAHETSRAAMGPGDAPPAPATVAHPAGGPPPAVPESVIATAGGFHVSATVPAPTPAPAPAPKKTRTRAEAALIAKANGKTVSEIGQAILDGTIFEMTATMPDIVSGSDALKLGHGPKPTPATIPDGAVPGGKPTEGQDLNKTAAREPAASRDTQQPANYSAGTGSAAKPQGADKNPPVAAPKKADVPESAALREDEKDEKKMALVAWEQAKAQVIAFRSASFNLVTRDLVQASHVAEALGAKKSAKAVAKLIVLMKDVLDEATTMLKDFDQAHSYFKSEIGGGGEPPAEEPAAEPGEAAEEKPAPPKDDEKPKPEEKPPAEKGAEKPAAPPVPPKKEESAQTSALSEASYTDPKDRAVARLVKDGRVPAMIAAGEEPYGEIADSIRVRCPDLNLNAYDIHEVIDRIRAVETVAAQKVLGITLDEGDRKLLAMVVTPRDQAVRSLLARTADGREAVVSENDLQEAVELLRRFGDHRHKLLADDLVAKMKVEVASAR